MKPLRVLSAVEQVAAYLREEILVGNLSGEMPGVEGLALKLAVNHKTVEAALVLLGQEGLLEGRGPRRRRRIVAVANRNVRKELRIGILTYEADNRMADYLCEIRHRLADAGHSPFFSSRSMVDLSMNVERVARHVESTPADAWLVVAASRPVLEWFSRRKVPVFALFGFARNLDVAMAAPEKVPAYQEVVSNLIGLGHRRIVLLARQQRILPRPGAPERVFLESLEAGGVVASPYNLPLWENSREGFQRQLASLFLLTPPTALIIQEPLLFYAALQFLGKHRIRVPEDVSLVCDDPDPNFAWQEPKIAHISWNSAPWIKRVVDWAANISHGKDDRRKVLSKAIFVRGGTIGPAPKG